MENTDKYKDFNEQLIDKILIAMTNCFVGSFVVGWAIFHGLICCLFLWLGSSEKNFN